MRRPRAILFDYGDTVVKITAWDFAAARRRIYDLADNPRGASYEEVDAYADRIVDAERASHAVSTAEFHQHNFHRLLFDRFGMTFDQSPAELEQLFWDAAVGHELTEGFTEMLDALGERDIRAAVVSNATFSAALLHRELRPYGIADRFEFIMSSAEYGFAKPQPLIYETAAGRLSLPPQDVWFIGDRTNTDVAGANGAGMTSVWYTGAIEREKTGEPHLHISNWGQLIEAIDRCATDRVPR